MRTEQNRTAQHSAAQYSTVQHSTAQHSTAQHSTAQHSTAQHSTAQHSTAQNTTAKHSKAQHSTAKHSKAQHSTAQHSTAQHSTAQHSTAQHSRAEHSTVQRRTANFDESFRKASQLCKTFLLCPHQVISPRIKPHHTAFLMSWKMAIACRLYKASYLTKSARLTQSEVVWYGFIRRKIIWFDLRYVNILLHVVLVMMRNASSPAAVFPELDPTASHNVPCIDQQFFQWLVQLCATG